LNTGACVAQVALTDRVMPTVLTKDLSLRLRTIDIEDAP